MKKIIFLCSILLLISCNNENNELTTIVNSISTDSLNKHNAISIQEAACDLNRFITDVYGSQSRANDSNARIIKNVYIRNLAHLSRTSQEPINIYVFNFENNNGFALMSADTRLPSLLAFIEEGNLSENDTITNPGLSLFLSGLRPNIGDDEVPKELAPIDSVIAYTEYGSWNSWIYQDANCSVKWSQDAPYNTFCPIINWTT